MSREFEEYLKLEKDIIWLKDRFRSLMIESKNNLLYVENNTKRMECLDRLNRIEKEGK